MANDFGNGGGFGLDKEVSNKLKSPNVHEKEDEYTGRMVLPIMTFKFVMGVLSVLCGAAFYLFQIRNFLHLAGKIPIYYYCIIPVIFIASLILLHGVTIDVWVPHIANSRIGSSYCKIGLKTITMDYDLLNSKKDINKFVEEITDKSEDWNYFIKKISPRSMTIKLSVRPKVKIPTKANFNGEYVSNEQWNYIPLGICLTDESVLGSINWMLNDNNKVKGSHKEVIPSTSFLVAGGTGSGKSVLENNIIRHCNTFSDNFQAMLVDVKRVEFGGLSNLEGIKAVALDIPEAEACLRASREIMYSRFKFMEKSGVNNVYKLKDFKCSYFCVENPQSGVRRLYQFDEIFYSEVDGKVEITTIDELYKKTESSEVKIYFSGQKENSLKVERDIEKCKSNPGSLFIREITPGDFYSFNKQIFAAKATLKTDNGDMTAEQIFDIVSKGKTVNINGTPANKDNYSCIECTFKPKAILTVVDEMSEVMSTTNYKAQASISDSISSIARLGRAAACHLCLAPLPDDLEVDVFQDREKAESIIVDYIKNLNNKINGNDYNLPKYFENYSNEEIKEQIEYCSIILAVIENAIILGETDKVSLHIKWEDLHIGDIFSDDSVVIYIGDWSQEQCYKLIAEDGSSIEASSTHLFKVNIYKEDICINDSFELSSSIRSNLKEDDSSWICVEDIISAINKNMRVYLDCGSEIVSYKKTDIKNVRCIQTTKGEYAIEGK